MSTANPFLLETLVDFPDDALEAPVPLTPAHIDTMMKTLKGLGIRRVSWIYYRDARGGYLTPGMVKEGWRNLAETYQVLGNPLKVAADAAHRHGLEIYGYYKPYETGPAIAFPDGSLEAKLYGRIGQIGARLGWLDPFVADHPELRIRRKSGDRPADLATKPIAAIRLINKDDTPTRITKDHLQIWTSQLNYQYRRLDVAFDLRQTVEPARAEVLDIHDNVVTRKGDPVRILTLSGLNLTDPYVMVTTDFTDGPADFENAAPAILEALDDHGRTIPGVFAPGNAIWMSDEVDFRHWGLIFDHGYGHIPIRLDEPNGSGKKGLIGFARGRNEYLPGALCETEPAVQDYWLQTVEDILDAGVDGVDFREENHSTHTDFAADYGFNQVILDRAGTDDPAAVAKVRGDAYTDFLRRAKRLINQRGKKMRIQFQIDYYRPQPAVCRLLAYPANLDFQWQRWIEEGLTDQATFRFFNLKFEQLFTDPIARELIDRCRNRQIPLDFNRYIRPDTLLDEYRRVRAEKCFTGFTLYETQTYLRFTEKGDCELKHPQIQTLADLHAS